MKTLIPSAAAASLNDKGVAMKGFVQDIEGLAIKNVDVRRAATVQNIEVIDRRLAA